MLVFIDESGNPHAHDENEYSVVVAMCLDERHSRAISRRIHAMKRDVLQAEGAEMKGQKHLSQRAFRSSPVKRVFAENFFTTLRNSQVTVFAAIMRGPFEHAPPTEGEMLGYRFRVLLERVNFLALERDAFANLLFDGRGTRFGRLSNLFSNYLHRSNEGRSRTRVTDSPAFVESAYSTGIQIADMCAYVLRTYYENGLFANQPRSNDEYSHAVIRWYRTIEQMTRNDTTSDGERRPGLYRLPRGVR